MSTTETKFKTAGQIVAEDLSYIIDSLTDEFAELSGKRILITGGAGFLGYYLVQSLLHYNNQVDDTKSIHVVVYDNYFRGIPQWLQTLRDNENLDLIKHDVTNPLPEDISDFEYIIHAASIASPTYYRKYPLETMDANVNGLRRLLDYCCRLQEKGAPVEGFLFFSTSEIYGDPDPDNIPTPESYRGNVSCTGPRACYDESKRYGETLCVTYARQYGIPVKIARPFNNYGPGLKITDRRVIPDFMRDVLSGNNIKMYSDGSPSRTFCYIADAIIGYYKILIKGEPGEPYNIGAASPEITIKELAEKTVSIARDFIHYKGKIEYASSSDTDYLIDNPNRRCPDIRKAKKELGYHPSTDLETGLLRNLYWYKENQGEK